MAPDMMLTREAIMPEPLGNIWAPELEMHWMDWQMNGTQKSGNHWTIRCNLPWHGNHSSVNGLSGTMNNGWMRRFSNDKLTGIPCCKAQEACWTSIVRPRRKLNNYIFRLLYCILNAPFHIYLCVLYFIGMII
jgi:hypothetical protein